MGPFLLKSSDPASTGHVFPWSKAALAALEMVLLPVVESMQLGPASEVKELCPPSCLTVHLGSAGPAQLEDFYCLFIFCSRKIHNNICIGALIISSFGVYWLF